jgi:hypothetical protein
MQRLLFHHLNLLTFLIRCPHNQSMAAGHYIAVLVPNPEMGGMLDWLNEFLPTWAPLPCTSYTKASYLEMLEQLAAQDAPGLLQFIPLLVETERDVMFAKLTWNVIKHYPWDQHPM